MSCNARGIAAATPATVIHADTTQRHCKVFHRDLWLALAQALPASVPQLSQADAEATEYPPLARATEARRQLASDWLGRLSADATGSASPAAFRWALAVGLSTATAYVPKIHLTLPDTPTSRPMLHLIPYVTHIWSDLPVQVVQSRTCGSAARAGGVGVRMLVPLVDMLNHGGDEKAGTSHSHIATDSVRWAPCSRAYDTACALPCHRAASPQPVPAVSSSALAEPQQGV